MAHSQPAAPRSGRTWSTDPGQAANGQRYSLGSAHRRSVARHARAIRQLEFGLCALHTLEQARRVGCHIRNLGESWATSRQGACHRFHHREGAPACRRRKRGNQNQQALGRSRGGFSTKIHLRTNAKGDPLTFDVTGGEAHEVKGYDALMELYDNDPDRLLGDKGYDSDNIRNDLAEGGILFQPTRSSFDFKMILAPWRISKCASGYTNSAFSNAALQISKFSTRAITSS